ncbi:unnamed protein product [Penicillium roqueforti FM164]|uniref:Genomic scaffold, ProqFM164S04 n=1 Tax=Penicillium roqueforti (strain FM164) TaxID=1365484 RepID=W6QP15_PENRF|nr:unnamed protein product [Penicillium roqueforti FM164]
MPALRRYPILKMRTSYSATATARGIIGQATLTPEKV